MLLGDVTWYTDHKALESLRTTLADSPRRARWREELDNFPFQIRYRKGKDMHVDGFTRHSTWPQDNGYGGTDPILDLSRFEPSDAADTLHTALASGTVKGRATRNLDFVLGSRQFSGFLTDFGQRADGFDLGLLEKQDFRVGNDRRGLGFTGV